MLVNASSAIALANNPVPVTGLPAEAVNPLKLMLAMLYVVACGVSISFPKVTLWAMSLQIVSI